MRILFFIIPLLLTILICFFNGLYDGSYLLLPLFCNENIYNKIKSNKLFLLFPYIGEIIGSVFLGHLVLKKIQYHFIDILSLSHNQLFISVIIILSITVFIYLISSFLPFVVSLSHTIIGGLVGIGYFYNVKIYWENLVITTILWTITPVISLIVGYLVFNLIKIFVYKSTLSYKFAIFFSFLTFFFLATFILFIFYKISRIGFLIILLIIFFILFIILKKISKNEGKNDFNFLDERFNRSYQDKVIKNYKKLDNIFTDLSISILPFVFLSHGANDIANSVALFSIIALSYFNNYYIIMVSSAIILGSGIILVGVKRAKKISCNIMQIESSKIYASFYSLSLSIIVLSFFGFRISSTYTLTGSYIGLGYARGFSIFNAKLIFELLLSWVITFGASIFLSNFISYLTNF